jgi:hypothetical protein
MFENAAAVFRSVFADVQADQLEDVVRIPF